MQKLDCYMSSSHLRCHNDWIECLDWSKRAGFSGVEFFYRDAFGAFEELSDERCADIAAHAQKIGMKIVAHPWFDWTAFSEKKLIQAYMQLIQRCADMGMPYVNMHMAFISDRKQGMKRLLCATDAVLPILEDTHMTLLYENIPEYGIRDLGSEAWDFGELFKHYSADIPVKMNIDTGHAHIMHSMQTLAEDFGDRWAYTHINDNNQLKDLHIAPGQGTMNFETVAKLARNANYAGPLLMEYNQMGLSIGITELGRTYGAEGYILDQIDPEPYLK